MKVKELINELQKFNSDVEVFGWSEDENLLDRDRGFILLDITGADFTQGEFLRLKDGTPYIKLGKSGNSQEFMTLNLTTDF